jgi:HD-GYP domain-containing protein (c-di-GMP phosphodiesterase class II)
MDKENLLNDFIVENVEEFTPAFIRENAHAIPHIFKVSLFEGLEVRRDKIPDIISYVIEQVTSFDTALVYIWEPWDMWFCRGIQGNVPKSLDKGNLFTHTVKKSGRHVLIRDIAETRLEQDDIPFSFSSMMALPLYLDSNTVGCLELYRKGGEPFNSTELALVKQVVLLSEKTIRDALGNGKRVGDHIDVKMDIKPRDVVLEILHQYEEQARRLSYPLSIALVTMNEVEKNGLSEGVFEGISSLRKVARKLKESLRCYDNIIRYEDMSFFVILPGCTSEQAKKAIEKASRGLEENLLPSMYIGIASMPDEAQDIKGLIYAVHQAVTYAKKSCLKCACYFQAGTIRTSNLSAELSVKKVLSLSPGPETFNQFIDILKLQCQAEEIQLRSTPPGDLLVWGNADLGFFKHKGLSEEIYKWLVTYISPSWAYIKGLSTDVQDWSQSILSVFSILSDMRAGYPIGYSLKVADHMFTLATSLGMREEDATRWANSALTANLGYMGMPSSILTKDELSSHDKKKISWHPIISANILKDACVLNCDDDILTHHHENIDGSGYPRGLKGSEIPIGARALRIADTYNAMMSPRLYRPQKMQDEAIRELYMMSGTKLDSSMTPVFIDAIGS